MSNSIQYNNSDFPSFPFLNIEVSNAEKESYVPQQGKIDTGSFITVIPEYMVKLLSLRRMTSVDAGGFGSEIAPHDGYFIHVKIGDEVFQYIKVISQPDEKRPNVLLGRNILNLWHMHLNGETHTGTFSIWSKNTSNAT